ncbi:MAG: 2OG-Fe(II) oxygenase [Betaproteobacteria bacterium]
MPRAGFFAQLGMFAVPGFFDAAMCESLRNEMQSSPAIPAPVLSADNQARVDEDQRRTAKALVSAATRTQVMSRLSELRHSLENHFGTPLSNYEPLSFLIYKEGYAFHRHTDSSRDPAAPAAIRERRVSVSIFLNGEGDRENAQSYRGGSLTFYGSPANRDGASIPEISLAGEEGLLIGFRSDWAHAVKPITRGVRYSIVTWFK